MSRSYGPAGVANFVVPGRKPCFHLTPPLREVAHPMLEAPPFWNRPDWKADTIVFPTAKVSGSTWVRW